jgi:ubiquitin thioesterase OTU1
MEDCLWRNCVFLYSYCEWILTKEAWGGAIEVQILAEYFQYEIVVVDIKSGA